MRAIRRFNVRAVLPEPLAPLEALAHNLRWCWSPNTRDLFAAMDAKMWKSLGQDPVRLLGEITAERLAELAADEGYVGWVRERADDLQSYLTADRWFQSLGADAPAGIAYFSPEYGITSALPQYSGGLGILAGDHLKAASDLGVPLIAIGLFYRAGYFRQSLSTDGWQQEQYPLCDPDGSPVTLLREADSASVKVSVDLPGGRKIWARIWIAQVGRVPLLMLDSDVEENAPAERDVTDRLYGGGGEHRLQQEMLLGIGGVRALRAYCRLTGRTEPEVFHTNEGHAGFLGFERIRELLSENSDMGFDEALEVIRAGTVFTTHTPVPAGIDRFPRELVTQYLGGANGEAKLPVERIIALGAETYPGGDPNVFNMAVMGLRLGQRANGVSLLHGRVSREMFAGLWPGFDADDVPIASITNGVHAPTWVAREILDIAANALGPDQGDEASAWAVIAQAGDEHLWGIKRSLREQLIVMARERLRASWINRGASEMELKWVDNVLDPDVLTIGFARRVPSYKRLTLMLRDQERLRALLLDPIRPVQLVIAGKSHPADDGGKRLIQELVKFADEVDVRNRIVFLPDYDISMATLLYPGCDVWLNNPIRPLEASGTSGMKAALNGALNLSILDGWWDEWFDGQNGWAIPTADGIDDPDRRDDIEAAALYDLIENSVASTFYDRDAHGMPRTWIAMVRHTLGTLGPKVLASRMVREYVTRLYTPAAISSREMRVNDFALAAEVSSWKTHVRVAWPELKVDHVESHGVGDAVLVGTQIMVKAFVSLANLTTDDVVVQIVFGRVDADDRIVQAGHSAMAPVEQYEGNRWQYQISLPLEQNGPFGYTVRMLPRHRGLATPEELGLQVLAQGIAINS
ncbi:MAG: alpha-glucan family phosphorylase [Actinobacteria bacterium]|uniref:glycogen phosphorylase n=1 Tax=freshwater metagenome TaxID=449393 RepID=A0A6J7AJ28_9ZZZZ|nr:alpha-glucan family phosphorylase [Actinomycetota bacterium]